MKLPNIIFAAALAMACVAALLAPGAVQARAAGQESSSKPAPPPPPADKKSGGAQTPAGAAPPAAPDGSDPISRRINNTAPALHDVEVGQYYMKREKYDAAIDRFKDATVLLPDYGLPYKLMGEAYEKKKFLPEAMQAYQKYLKFNISKPEAEDIGKRISRLQGEIQEQDKRREAATKP